MMSRLTLIHWDLDEVRSHVERLRRAGHVVRLRTNLDGESLHALRNKQPDLYVIDLGRRPSQGQAIAIWLRQQKATRSVPIVFIEGDPQKTARVRKIIPDAIYTEWKRILSAVRSAVRKSPKDPVVPGTMASYSGTPLPKKLGIRAGSRVALLGAPRDFGQTLGVLPEDVRLQRQVRGRLDTILLFVRSHADLDRRFPSASRPLVEKVKLWIAWPKKSSGIATDLTSNSVRAYGLAAGLVDFKICAIDDTWSALCFTRRRAGRSSR